MKKENKLKLAGTLLGATLITATAGVAAETKTNTCKSEATTTKDANLTSKEMTTKKKMLQEHAKAADKKQAVSKWG